ncbi:MAG TPA: glycosyltransferase [Actinomycetota bacterium]|nr:glycosyltransferase [Actinomycetota bacterium]
MTGATRLGRPEARRRAPDGPVRLLLVGHDLHGRGTERSVVRLLQNFDRSVVEPVLALVHARGEFLADVPADVPVREIAPGAQRTSGALRQVVRLVASEKPDCVLGIHTSPSRLVALARLTRPRTPVICWEPDPFRRVEGDKGGYALRRAVTAATHRLASVVLCPSDVVADEVARELWLARDDVVVLPHPSVDAAVLEGATEPATEPPFGEGRPVIVNVGNMHEHKSQRDLLEAFADVRSRRECSLVVIGKGPLEAELRARAAELGVAADVHFYGFRANPFKYVAAADAFASSATSEGFDISQVEAMACGTPVVVTDSPRYRVVEAERTGLLVPPGRPQELARALDRLLDDPALVRRLTEAARVRARDLDAATVTRAYENLVLKVAGR